MDEIYKKPGYDSRQHFAKFLVELKQEIKSIRNDYTKGIEDWLESLREYYSHCKGHAKPELMKEWLQHWQEVVNYAKKTLSHPKRIEIEVNILTPEIYKLQDDIFEITAHLFLPSSEDEKEDFDPRSIIPS